MTRRAAWDAVRSMIDGVPMPDPGERMTGPGGPVVVRHGIDGQLVSVEPLCPACEGGGWVEVYSPRPPAFGVCEACFNPEDLPSP